MEYVNDDFYGEIKELENDIKQNNKDKGTED